MSDNERFPSPHVFSGLEPGTKYKFTSVYPAEGNKLESPESPVLEASTRFLVDNDGWTVGQGPVDGFELRGPESGNRRELKVGPFGVEEMVWIADGFGQTANGGYFNREYPVNPLKTYVEVVFFKALSNNSGQFFHFGKAGTYDVVSNLAGGGGTTIKHPAFGHVDITSLALNVWHVSIVVVHSSDTTEYSNIGGIYNMNTKARIVPTSIIKLKTNSTNFYHGAFKDYETLSGRQIWFASPIVRELEDLSLEDILSGDRERVFYKNEII